MDEQYIYNLILLLSTLILGIISHVTVITVIVRRKFAPVRTEPAIVLGTHPVDFLSKITGNSKYTKYVAVFSVKGKRKSFYVTQNDYFSFDLYDEGMLTYKGPKLLEFKSNP